MMALASTILANEQEWYDVEVNKQYELLMDAQERAKANPNDFEAQVFRVLQEDRLSHVNTMRDLEMQNLVGETRLYLSRL